MDCVYLRINKFDELIAYSAVAYHSDYIHRHRGCILHSASGENTLKVNTFTRKAVTRHLVFIVALFWEQFSVNSCSGE